MREQIVTPEKWERVNQESKELLKEFMLTLRQEGRSKATLSTYMQMCRLFLVYVLDHYDNRCITELRKKDFRNYSLYLRDERCLSSATHNHYVSAVKSWCDRLEDDDDIDYEVNACRKIKGIKIERVRKITFLTDGEVSLLYEELLRQEKYQIALFLALAYDSTGRRSEIMQVEKEGFYDKALDRTNEVIKKGGRKDPLVYFNRTKEAAALWLEQRGEDDNPSLWVGHGSRERKVGSANSWCEYMSRVLSEIGGKKVHFTPHSLRHSAIENLTEGSHYKCEVRRIPYDIRAVSGLAGHASIEMTEYYKKNKGFKDVEDAFGVKVS